MLAVPPDRLPDDPVLPLVPLPTAPMLPVPPVELPLFRPEVLELVAVLEPVELLAVWLD